MNASHNSVDVKVRDRLWADSEFVDIVKHVFDDIDPNSAEVLASAEWGISHGYWRPHGTLVKEAVARGLVGNGRAC
jgi:hypothetical protein